MDRHQPPLFSPKDQTTTVVITNLHRQPSIVPHLDGNSWPHNDFAVLDSQPPDPPPSLPEKYRLAGYSSERDTTREYRCFQGHTAANALIDTEFGLILEDDILPNFDDYPDPFAAIEGVYGLLKQYEIVFLGSFQPYAHCPPGLVIPSDLSSGYRATAGAQAYMVTKAVAQRISVLCWQGVALDVILCNEFRTAYVAPNIFLHDLSQKSVIGPMHPSVYDSRWTPNQQIFIRNHQGCTNCIHYELHVDSVVCKACRESHRYDGWRLHPDSALAQMLKEMK